MTTVEKLIAAQALLSDVYHEALIDADSNLESLMSAADSCICEALDCLTEKSKEKNL